LRAVMHREAPLRIPHPQRRFSACRGSPFGFAESTSGGASPSRPTGAAQATRRRIRLSPRTSRPARTGPRCGSSDR
jgi:hypothetical protein